MSAYSIVKSGIVSSLGVALSKLSYTCANLDSSIDFSKRFGDISCSISFSIAKDISKGANSIAEEIKSIMQKPEYIEKITAEGGFINFHLDRHAFMALLFEGAKEKAVPKAQTRVVIEYPSVNPNKPWHIGHLRNALLGDSVSNIYAALGYDVQRQNYIDDLGLQMAESMWWYLSKGENRPGKKFDHWLGEEYVEANRHIEDINAKEEIAKTLALMEQDGTYESELLRKVASECVMAQYETSFDYSICQDMLVWESDIIRARIFERAMDVLSKASFIETPKKGDYANCTIINLEKISDLPEEFRGLQETAKVLVRSDGTPTYLGKDIAFHMWKFGMLEDTFRYSIFIDRQRNGNALHTTSHDGKPMKLPKAGIAINVIGGKQSHPQSILRLVFSSLGRGDIAENIRHLAYGEVELESGSLAGRKGTWIGYSADDLLRETKSRTRKLISERFKLDEKEEEMISNSVALAAIKFEFLKMGTEKKIVFSWKRALNFEGNSGPYAQYMHARATRILEDAPKASPGKAMKEMPAINDYEFALAKLISKSSEMVEKAERELRPSVLTEYINELAYSFAAFYENCPILKADSSEEQALRLRLASSFKDAIKEMLRLLGIEALERM